MTTAGGQGARTVRAAIYRSPGQVEVIEHAWPELAPDEVLVSVAHCGVCGTDLHVMLDGWGLPDTIGGHEWSGRVLEVGTAVERWAVDDAVVGVMSPTCGTCALCEAGRPSLCLRRPAPGARLRDGAFAEVVVLPEGQLVAVPDGVDLRHAAFAEPLAVALHAVTLSGAATDGSTMVSGAGPIGAAIVAVLRHRGHDRVTVVEPGARRGELAASLGAEVLRPDELSPAANAWEVADESYDVVFECSGVPSAIQTGLAMLDRRGTLVLVGSGIDRPELEANRVLLNELTITGAFNYDADGFAAALGLLGDETFPIETLLEPDSVGLEGLSDAMVRLRSGELAGKVLVEPGGGSR